MLGRRHALLLLGITVTVALLVGLRWSGADAEAPQGSPPDRLRSAEPARADPAVSRPSADPIERLRATAPRQRLREPGEGELAYMLHNHAVACRRHQGIQSTADELRLLLPAAPAADRARYERFIRVAEEIRPRWWEVAACGVVSAAE